MAKTRFIQNNFTSGVLSSLLKGRTDIAQYYNSVEVGENWVVVPQGGIRKRPGTKHIDVALPKLTRDTTTPTMPNGGTAANINDEDDSTTTATTTAIGTNNPYVVAKYDLGTAQTPELFDVRQISVSSGTSADFKIQYSDDDISYFDAAALPLIGSNAQDFRLKNTATGAHRYWRLARIGSADMGAATVTLADFNIWYKSSTLSQAKTTDFSVETDRHYLFVFTEGNLRIYRKDTDAHVADIKVPYLDGEVMDLRRVQSEAVMLVFHENHPVKRIINLGTDTDWTIDDAPFTNIPQFDYNDSLSPTPVDEVQDMTFNSFTVGQQFQIDVEGVLSKNITFAGASTADERSATAENIRKNLQDMPKFGESGISVAWTAGTTFRITISGESTKAFELFSGFPTTGAGTSNITFVKVATGSPRAEDVWSATRGYPKLGAIFEGRLFIGGTRSKPQSLFASKAGSFFDFEIDEGDDDDAIFTTIASRTLSNIVDVYPGRSLQIFTDGAELNVTSQPITPQTVAIIPQTFNGAKNIEVKSIDGASIFADRNGKTIRTFVYSFNEDAYIANNVSVLSPEIIKDPVDISILGGTGADDANWIFITNQDGSATILNTLREQDITAFTEWTTSGFITNSSVVDDQLYMVNRRTVNGSEVYHIEKWSFDHLMDDSVRQSPPTPRVAVTGLDHLIGETVRVIGDGVVLPDRVVKSDGTIDLNADEAQYVNFEVGIGFVSRLRPMPIATNIGSGTNEMRLKKIVRMNVRVKDTFGLYIEGEPAPIRQFGENVLDVPPAPKTGIIEDVYGLICWDRYDTMPEFTVPDPTPCQILAIEYEVESS